MRKLIFFFADIIILFLMFQSGVQTLFAQAEPPGRQEILRGSITPEREWWDLLHYHLSVQFFPETKTIKGSNVISFKTIKSEYIMQIDLQEPLAVTKITHKNSELKFKREGNVYLVYLEEELPKDIEDSITVYWEGRPTESKNPPWSGGVTWGRDDLGDHFIVTTAQGIGASIWWANKDHGADEPDRGMNINITVPENLTAVSNGRLIQTDANTAEKTKTFRWQVTTPINN
jgi:aminopeptidase N